MLEKFTYMSEEDIKKTISSLSDTDKLNLVTEINNKVESTKAEKIRLETIQNKLKEDEKECMKELAEYGINDYSSLDSEILKLENEIDNALIEYVNKIKGE